MILTNMFVLMWKFKMINLADKKIENKKIDIQEEIEVVKNKNKLFRLDIKIIIPKNYEAEEIELEPRVFDGLREYKKIKINDISDIKIKIINKSKYNYKYKNNSVKIETYNINNTDINNYKSKGVGFDNKKIYEIFKIKRSYNEALYGLYDDGFKEEYLTNEVLDYKLKNKGYIGVIELDKYYRDYYNNKYKETYASIDEMDEGIKEEIFRGKVGEVYEDNEKIIEEAYNYFYKNIMSITFDKQIVTNRTNSNYSIYAYMNSNMGDEYMRELLGEVKANKKKIINIRVNINNKFFDSFKDYNYYGNFSFKLEKE